MTFCLQKATMKLASETRSAYADANENVNE
jgi:hypothetical protein